MAWAKYEVTFNDRAKPTRCIRASKAVVPDNGALLLASASGDVLAAFAPGVWLSVTEVKDEPPPEKVKPPPETTDD